MRTGLNFIYRLRNIHTSRSFTTIGNCLESVNIGRKCNFRSYSSTAAKSNPVAATGGETAKTLYPGAPSSSYTSKLHFYDTHKNVMDTFRILQGDGVLIGEDPKISDEVLLKMYRTMIKLNTMDSIMYEAQRQGRISFYMTSYGEEATHMGSAAALSAEDVVFGQYREAGVLMYRGFEIDEFMNQV